MAIAPALGGGCCNGANRHSGGEKAARQSQCSRRAAESRVANEDEGGEAQEAGRWQEWSSDWALGRTSRPGLQEDSACRPRGTVVGLFASLMTSWCRIWKGRWDHASVATVIFRALPSNVCVCHCAGENAHAQLANMDDNTERRLSPTEGPPDQHYMGSITRTSLSLLQIRPARYLTGSTTSCNHAPASTMYAVPVAPLMNSVPVPLLSDDPVGAFICNTMYRSPSLDAEP
ncbi:hypothetical protein K458DRAFT_382963 [Lentithecium fluviatile CBS 122367]|uniref:Uncharacterized protein n=1 Tax=Lentithecium fluviatile CBS 122367 TaxID=1168545 RepID=A0A6G1JH93_9PLEO|nr:hypothetical protein K458DRAFT_382963 [Lentithecium fluviatile CBS 122367]